MDTGSLIVLHLASPSEKYWGVLEHLGPSGITVRGINLSSFDDWVTAVAREELPSLGLISVFFPMHRVERMFHDETVGAVESFADVFRKRLGIPVEGHLEALDQSRSQNST